MPDRFDRLHGPCGDEQTENHGDPADHAQGGGAAVYVVANMYRFAHRLFGSNPPAAWYSTDGAEMGKMMVAEGIGLTVLPDYSVLGDPLERAGMIVTRPLVGDTTIVTMTALHRRQARVTPAVVEVLGHLREQARHRLPARTA